MSFRSNMHLSKLDFNNDINQKETQNEEIACRNEKNVKQDLQKKK